MIVFHEGLPGSGKSYEACAMHILPALDRARRVVTNIEGINHAKFSELLHIPELDLKDKLICVFDHDIEQQKKLFLEYSGKDALIIIDEIQNLFPTGRQQLSTEWNRYISEHRHDGLDIVLMGQDRRDCHPMWRRRIQRVITFNKLSAVGLDKRYRWECYEATSPEKFKKVTGGNRSYDKKYFGLYQSHTEGTDNKDVYKDKRANVLNNKSIRFAVPAVIVVLYFAVSFLYDFFTPNSSVVAEIPKTSPKLVQPQREKIETVSVPSEPAEPPPIDIFDKFAKSNRLRLSALVVSQDKSKFFAQIDVLDNSYHRQEVFNVQGLRDMGWQVTYRDSGLYITKQGVTHIARSWPIDKFGKVDNDTMAQL
ncbi:MAG: zonular occludens toxin domain-containing protein [Zhongshania sp.]|uniref:zonular occludens toxin family protein n=1 Tax=Zhongshania sp. TaxID=1971902 RepID=UPI00261BE3A4|nr:zonular occludens toxin domain-containing protein [Zhongshania sp.]MDF1693286.1 zonular occludens toxin domain-containing protein [Zhongshania sp.]MDF1693297.1 zonular occludens toxin domain-containing protein [Zhongshania sp.]